MEGESSQKNIGKSAGFRSSPGAQIREKEWSATFVAVQPVGPSRVSRTRTWRKMVAERSDFLSSIESLFDLEQNCSAVCCLAYVRCCSATAGKFVLPEGHARCSPAASSSSMASPWHLRFSVHNHVIHMALSCLQVPGKYFYCSCSAPLRGLRFLPVFLPGRTCGSELRKPKHRPGRSPERNTNPSRAIRVDRPNRHVGCACSLPLLQARIKKSVKRVILQLNKIPAAE